MLHGIQFMHRVMDPARDCQKLESPYAVANALPKISRLSLRHVSKYRSKDIETSCNNKIDSRARNATARNYAAASHGNGQVTKTSDDPSSRRPKSRNWEMKSRNRKMEKKNPQRKGSVIRAHWPHNAMKVFLILQTRRWNVTALAR